MATAGEAPEDELIIAARNGDHDAFGQLIDVYRGELHAHCYRMLGSAADADDALQETLLRAWRGIRGFEGRGSLRGWLYTIATNACLRLADHRARRTLPVDYGPAAGLGDGPATPPSGSPWIEPYPTRGEPVAAAAVTPEARYDQRESVELAFIVALQQLTPGQRAALILHDVLGFAAAEIAAMTKSTPASVYSALQRAHKTMRERLPQISQQVTLRRLGDAGLRELAARYADAWQAGDIDAIVTLLTEDATMSMPPLPAWFGGPDAIRPFLATWVTPRRSRLVPAWANGQLAFGHYRLDDVSGLYLPHSLDVITIRGARVAAVTGFVSPGLFAVFGLDPTAEDQRRRRS